VFRVFEKWGLDAVEVGLVTRTTSCACASTASLVAEIPNEALTDDAPLYKRPLERWEPPVERELPSHVQLTESGDLTGNYKRLLGKREHLQQALGLAAVRSHGADQHCGRARSGDAGVIRIKGSQRGLAMAPRRKPSVVLSGSAAGRECTPWPRPAATWLARARLPSVRRTV